MKCQVVGCEKIATYYAEIDGSAGDLRTFKVMVCRDCYLDGWVWNTHDDEELKRRQEQELNSAETIYDFE